MKSFKLFSFLFLISLQLSFLSSYANTAPVLTRIKPENAVTDTIFIVKGQTVTFTVSGTDADGNMRGIEWYNNSFIGADGFTPTGSKSMSKTITFNTTGNYNVACVAYDVNNAYGNGITWKVKVIDFNRCAYVDYSDEVVGNSKAEDSLVQWAARNKINGLALYLPQSTMESHHPELNAFIGKVKANGIQEVSVVIGEATQNLTAALSYYDDPAVTNKFSGLLTEIEYWGAPAGSTQYNLDLNAYLHVLASIRNASDARNKGFKVESYMGGGQSQSEADSLCKYVDKILLVCYTNLINPSDVYYTYRRDRLQFFCNGAAKLRSGRSFHLNLISSRHIPFRKSITAFMVDSLQIIT